MAMPPRASVLLDRVGTRIYPAAAVNKGETTPESPSPRAHWAWLAVPVLAAAGLFLLMAKAHQTVHGVAYGVLITAAVALGVVRFFPAGGEATKPASWWGLPGEPRLLAPIFMLPAAAVVVIVGAFVGSYAYFPYVVVASLLMLTPAAIRRPALFIFVVVSFVYLPRLGAYGLWDPWETHYGEVSREILSRDDWISLWWAQDNWFWSKPILIFWQNALFLGALGVDFRPDANPVNAEWALRLPIFILAMGAIQAVYAAVKRRFSVRAGVLAALVLATLPHFFFLAHQAITDMPFVANMTMAMALLSMAIVEDPAKQVTTFAVGKVRFSMQHVVIAALVMLVLPQVMYLITRNVTLVTSTKFS